MGDTATTGKVAEGWDQQMRRDTVGKTVAPTNYGPHEVPTTTPQPQSPSGIPLEQRQLSVFTRDGKTFTFRDVFDITTNEWSMTFGYVAMSDGRMKKGTFFVQNLAGYSTTT